MTLRELKERSEKAGFAYAYGKFEEATPPPHLVSKDLSTENIMADDKVYFGSLPIKLDYTYTKKNLEERLKIENEILGDIPWNKTDETYLPDEDVWQVSYFFEILN